ncbi:uncharacterized protein LOC6561256 [Drosophila grimshawi]|uniref:GH20467 n=1 Tax=Drosophila grimshawi TaxID=7222 RepID=B4J9D4_DROGR|nr:uncharacterized protein LOC6561256 [Drosophila grimshawi]EDW01415.1 GH20467 [Drosophila grimshawi]
MSKLSKQRSSLGNEQLVKLTNESAEIRMLAFEQIETSFIHCLIYEDAITIKPMLLLRQLIRWFGFTPLADPDRILALMLELMRSRYGKVIPEKMSLQRLEKELLKIRLQCFAIPANLMATRCMDLLGDLFGMIEFTYCISSSSYDSLGSDLEFSVDAFNLQVEDYEAAWSCASEDDLATMATIVDSLSCHNDEQLQQQLLNLQIRVCDYPVEYLLQPPHIFLRLLDLLKLNYSTETQFRIHCALLAIVKQMQRGNSARSKICNYATKVEVKSSLQLRISSALYLLLNACWLDPPKLEQCNQNYHPIEMIVEVIETFGQLGAPMKELHVQQLACGAHKFINYCNSVDVSDVGETDNMGKGLIIPRLESIILNGSLLELIRQNASNISHVAGQALLKPLILDNTYMMCVPQHMDAVRKLHNLMDKADQPGLKEILLLKVAYKLAIGQLITETKLQAQELLMNHHEICCVLVRMGSKSLVQQLCEAIVKCTSLFLTQPELRLQAEMLLLTLLNLPVDSELRNYALQLLRQPVLEHYQAFMNGTNYLPDCSNIQLIRQHILGLPMSTHVLRELLVVGWRSSLGPELKEWCIEYLMMLLGLIEPIPAKEIPSVHKMLTPVMPLIVCRAIDQPQLQPLLWKLLRPIDEYMDKTQTLRGNICFLFYPDENMRTSALIRMGFILNFLDSQKKLGLATADLKAHSLSADLCVIKPPIEYTNVFNDRIDQSSAESLEVQLRLLATPHLKNSIYKSTLIQMNILMHNWLTAATFSAQLDAIFLRAEDDADLLLPTVSILQRALFRSEQIRLDFADEALMLIYLVRCLFLLPKSEQMRAEASTCLFLLLFPEHIDAKEHSIQLLVDLSAMAVPFTYKLNESVSPTTAAQGLIMHDLVLNNHFVGNAALEAQYWRLFLAQCACDSADNLTLSTMRELDIAESLKLKPSDLALVHATQVQRQLQHLLTEEANNCSSHKSLQYLVLSLQLFLIHLRGNIKHDQCAQLWTLLHKHLRSMPINEADRKLYAAMLELCLNCLRHRLPQVQQGLNDALESHPDHSFIVILHDSNVSLNLLHLVTECLVMLISSPCHQANNNKKNNINWHTKLFQELSILARANFEQRNLQRVRCLLSILRQLSEQQLHLDETQLQSYYHHFVQLSSNLRTNTHTGAQWQRDCLLVICQLQANSKLKPTYTGGIGNETRVLHFLIGLCSHCDREVRALAWVALANWCKSSGSKLCGTMNNLHQFLPGRLAARCLCTLLDKHEVMLVREIAGRLFELLMPHIGAALSESLLEQMSFLNEAQLAVGTLHLIPKIRFDCDRSKAMHSSEIISCYVSICVSLIFLNARWCLTLCEHAFFNALSNVLQIPLTSEMFTPYMNLCAGQICQLFALCYQHNGQFIQRIIYQDTLIFYYYELICIYLKTQPPLPENHHTGLLKLLMVFLMDNYAYQNLFSTMSEPPVKLLDLIFRGLRSDRVNGAVQYYTLQAILFLLSKEQNKFMAINVLDMFVEYEGETNEEEEDMDTSDKERNSANTLSQQQKMMSLMPAAKQNETKTKEASKSKPKLSATIQLYQRLDSLFELYYPAGKYSFLETPTTGSTQVCEALGRLLKLSPQATDMADKAGYKLLKRVIQLLEGFFFDAEVFNATVYMERVGADKANCILLNLSPLLDMLLTWHSAPHADITHPLMASRIVRVLHQLWPWLLHSLELMNMTVRLTVVLTQCSLEMCKQTAQVWSKHSKSQLHLMVRIATTFNHPIEMCHCALRVMINCCACVEGRLCLSKMRVQNIFKTILQACGGCKVPPLLQNYWLMFWEVFSRYEPGSKICHFGLLLNTVRRSQPLSCRRIYCLRIVRNMCFFNGNRMQLPNMGEFVDLLQEIVSQPVQDSYVEHHLVVTCLWKLFGSSAKWKELSFLRAKKLYQILTTLLDHLTTMQKDRVEDFEKLYYAIDLKDVLEKLFTSLQS